MQALQKYINGNTLVIKKNDKTITDQVLQSISGLEEIDINGLSEITTIDFIRNCPGLKFLSISQCEKINNFNSVKDVCLEKLEKLIIKQLINFDDNQDFIIMQKNIEYLKLEGVLIRGLKSLGQLTKLKELNLDHNMEIDCDDLLVEQQNYEKLSMENCIYINLQMDLSTLDKCVELDFRKNKIKAIQSNKDMAVTKMVLTLNLCIDILTPERFQNLTTLIANNCTLTSLSLVRRLTSLVNLDVSTNSILKLTDLENLKDLKKLTTLNICDNPVNKLYKFTQQLGKNIPESIQTVYYVNERDNMVNKVLSYKIDIPTLIRQLQAKHAVYARYREEMGALYRESRQLLNNINCAIITARPFLVEFKRRQDIINQQAEVLPVYRNYSAKFRSDYFIKRYEAAKKINAKSINAFFLANQGKDNLSQKQKVELQKICDQAGPCIFYVLATRKYQGIEEAFSREFSEQCGSIMCKNAEGVENLKDCPDRAHVAVQIIQKLYNAKKFTVIEKTDAELEEERRQQLEREMLINPELALQLAANYKKLKVEGLPSGVDGSQTLGKPPKGTSRGPSNRPTPRQLPALGRPESAVSQMSNATSLYSDFSIGKAAYIGK